MKSLTSGFQQLQNSEIFVHGIPNFWVGPGLGLGWARGSAVTTQGPRPRFEVSRNLEIQKFGIPWNPCDKDFRILDLLEPSRQDFRILDLLEPLRQRFQNFGPTGTLASKISEFWTYWNPQLASTSPLYNGQGLS